MRKANIGIVYILVFVFFTVFTIKTAVGSDTPNGYIPKDGFVPNEVTAVKIAEAVITALDSEKWMTQNRPYKGKLKKGMWVIKGKPGDEQVYLEISKKNGRIANFTIRRNPAF